MSHSSKLVDIIELQEFIEYRVTYPNGYSFCTSQEEYARKTVEGRHELVLERIVEKRPVVVGQRLI